MLSLIFAMLFVTVLLCVEKYVFFEVYLFLF